MMEEKKVPEPLETVGRAMRAPTQDGCNLEAGGAENGLCEDAGVRSIETVTEEIRFYKRQAGGAFLEIGKRLNEAKDMLPHGEWLPWLTNQVAFSERSAQNLMRLAREYGKSAEIADLGASKALALLALSDSERESFLGETHLVNGVEKSAAEMTGKELQEAIRARKEAEEQAKQAADFAQAAQADAEQARAEARQAEESRKKMEKDMKLLKERLNGLNEEVEDKTRTAQELEAQLAQLRAKPVEVAVQEPDPALLEQARAEARRETEAKLQAATEALDAARQEKQKKEQEWKDMKERLAEAERREQAAKKEAEQSRRAAEVAGNEEMATFKVLFSSAQQTINQMADLLRKIETQQSEQGQGLRKALAALAAGIQKVAEA